MNDPPAIANQIGARAVPTAAEVTAELSRVLASRAFEQAGRASNFLRFVVEQTLAGHGDRLKGYTIGVEVFERPPDFDAQNDPLVRVEAGRLRRRLIEYYATEGADDPVRIELPRGNYEPVFKHTEAKPAPALTIVAASATPATAAPQPRRPAWWQRTPALAAAAILVVAVAFGGVQRWRAADDLSAALALPDGPKLIVWQFENLSDDVNLGYFARGITEEVMVRLGTMQVFVIAADPQGVRQDSGLPEHVRRVGEGAPYTLHGTVRYGENRVRITARLSDAASGAQLWTADYDEDASTSALFSIQDQIARAVVDSIAVQGGPIFNQELARAVRKPAESLETYDCVLKYYDYRWTIDPKLHGDVLRCFQAAAVREPGYSDVWAGLALMYLDEYAFGFTPQDDPVGPLDRAREAARRALDIDGASVLGHFALARARYFVHDYDGFKRSAARALELDPNNPAVLASVAGLLAVGGDGDEALPLIEKGLALAPRQANVFYAVRTIIEIAAGRGDAGVAAALRIDAPNWFMGWLLLAAAAGLSEQPDVAQRAVARLLELRPDLATGVRAELDKWLIAKKLHANVLLGLSRAGMNTE